MSAVHFRDRILREVGVELLGEFDIAGKSAAVVGRFALLIQPGGLHVTVCEGAKVGAAAHIAVVVQSHTVGLREPVFLLLSQLLPGEPLLIGQL